MGKRTDRGAVEVVRDGDGAGAGLALDHRRRQLQRRPLEALSRRLGGMHVLDVDPSPPQETSQHTLRPPVSSFRRLQPTLNSGTTAAASRAPASAVALMAKCDALVGAGRATILLGMIWGQTDHRAGLRNVLGNERTMEPAGGAGSHLAGAVGNVHVQGGA